MLLQTDTRKLDGAPQTDKSAAWADKQTLDAVRPEVRKILEATPAFDKLSPDEKKDVASKMVKVATYMANPGGLALEQMATQPLPLAETQAGKKDPVEATKARLSKAPGAVGEDFEAGAVRERVEQFGQLVRKVDFPKFVSGLIKGVFEAIVDSSIEQMRAYGEMLANVAKAVDEFARDNISENNARDWLAAKYPEELGMETSDAGFGFAEGDEPAPKSQLVGKGDDPEAAAQKISSEMGLEKPVTDLSDPAEEQRLVLAARLEMARSRQQLLASMVMLGINRIVVTDGLIRAKVVFDMRASDKATRKARASMHDRQKETSKQAFRAGYSSWFSPWSASVSSESASEHVATVGSSVDDTSESKAAVKAKLSGEVRVNFKSDYLPMDKMASPEMIAAIQGNAQPPDKIVEGA